MSKTGEAVVEEINKEEEIKKQIERRKELIQNMKDDEEIFGLVGEDFAKIRKWKGEISELKQKLDLKSSTREPEVDSNSADVCGGNPVQRKGEK